MLDSIFPSPHKLSPDQQDLNQVFLFANYITTYLLGTSYKLEKKNFTLKVSDFVELPARKLPTYLTYDRIIIPIDTYSNTNMLFAAQASLLRTDFLQKKRQHSTVLFTIGEEKKNNSALSKSF